jgi:hypothetical protein
VYPGECLARAVDGRLFVARAGEPCVALQHRVPLEDPPSQAPVPEGRQPPPAVRVVPEAGGFCGTPHWVPVRAPLRN